MTAADIDAIRQTMADYDCDHWGLRIISASGFDADAAVALAFGLTACRPANCWLALALLHS